MKGYEKEELLRYSDAQTFKLCILDNTEDIQIRKKALCFLDAKDNKPFLNEFVSDYTTHLELRVLASVKLGDLTLLKNFLSDKDNSSSCELLALCVDFILPEGVTISPKERVLLEVAEVCCDWKCRALLMKRIRQLYEEFKKA